MGYNKLILHGNQICDYIYIQAENSLSFTTINSTPPTEWQKDTLFLSDFNNNSLSAGDSDIPARINGYEIRRQKEASAFSEYVGTITNANGRDKKYIIDYLATNNTDYTYYLYPICSNDSGMILVDPQVSGGVSADWGYWSLLLVDESEEENVFYLNKLFKFELNLSVDSMTNNAKVSVIHNFTKYPTVQYSPSNFWSGGLTSLCGYISCNDLDYIQTPDMVEELKLLTTDTRRKFLKDTDGNVWEVKITAPITITEEAPTVENVKNVKISWTEVAEVSNISIIDNPNKPTASWLLTDSGIPAPYLDYVWTPGKVWDNSKRWTAKDDLLNVDISNMGRDLFEKDGE